MREIHATKIDGQNVTSPVTLDPPLADGEAFTAIVHSSEQERRECFVCAQARDAGQFRPLD